MATRQSQSLALVRRCEKAGWPVERSTDGWKIQTPDGPYSIHMTYSDGRSLTNAVAELDRRGLSQLEHEVKAHNDLQRRHRIKADRDSAEKKLKEIQSQQQDMIVRAAGPYLAAAEACDLQWLTSPHPAPWMRWMNINAKAARILLDDFNSDNRTINQNDVERYRLIIASGQWHLTHQGIAIDTRPLVQDGQHRLLALIGAAEAIDDPLLELPFAVFVGMPVENFKAIDEGRLRTAAQMLSKAGEHSSQHLGTVIRTVNAFDSENPRYAARHKIGNATTFDVLGKDPERLREAVLFGARVYRRTKCTPGAMGAAYYVVGRLNGFDNPYFQAFFQGMAKNRKFNTDRVLPDDDPRKVLLDKFAVHRPKPIEAVFWVVASWNNMVEGHHPKYLRYNDSFPPVRPVLCKPGEGVTPRGLEGEVGDE